MNSIIWPLPAVTTVMSVRQAIHSVRSYAVARQLRPRCVRNWPSVPWAINKTPDLQRMIDFGATGIKTDYPTRLLQIVTTTK